MKHTRYHVDRHSWEVVTRHGELNLVLPEDLEGRDKSEGTYVHFTASPRGAAETNTTL